MLRSSWGAVRGAGVDSIPFPSAFRSLVWEVQASHPLSPNLLIACRKNVPASFKGRPETGVW